MFLVQPPPLWPTLQTRDAEHHRRYGNYLLLAQERDDNHVHLGRELLVTMMGIRIAMMTTVFARRHIEAD